MGKRDPRVDAYIEASADFARPILRHLREVVHEGCPEVEETMKWSFPHFEYRGLLCSMASFKQHCAFGFWKGGLVLEGEVGDVEEAMGQFGRIGGLEDLPPRERLVAYVQRAGRLNEEGVAAPRAKKPKGEFVVPEDLLAALREDPAALEKFEGFSPSQRREYAEWVAEAKREETRRRRIETAVEWIAEGKPRNWKYIRS